MKPLVAVLVTAAAAGAFGMVTGWSVDPRGASEGYLFAYTYAFSVVVGALFLLMIGHACDARWFVAVRRLAEHTVAVLPVLAIAFVPVLVFMPKLYPWTHLAELEPVAREYVSKKIA